MSEKGDIEVIKLMLKKAREHFGDSPLQGPNPR